MRCSRYSVAPPRAGIGPEPFPLCYTSSDTGPVPPDGPPRCEVRPPESPWCMAGRALYSAEVDRAIGHGRRSEMASSLA